MRYEENRRGRIILWKGTRRREGGKRRKRGSDGDVRGYTDRYMNGGTEGWVNGGRGTDG